MDEAVFHRMILLARAGDQDAADFLFVKAFDSLYPLVAKRIQGALRAAPVEPEDVIQDVYAAAWRQMPAAELADYRAFIQWLRTIARNHMVDLYRRMRADKRDVRRTLRNQGTSRSGYLTLMDHVAAVGMSPSQGAARQEALAILAGQMWRLPEDYRYVIRCRFIHGQEIQQIASELGRSEGAVHMLCHRALKALQRLMGSPSRYLSTA